MMKQRTFVECLESLEKRLIKLHRETIDYQDSEMIREECESLKTLIEMMNMFSQINKQFK